jgi:hypothetical protein
MISAPIPAQAARPGRTVLACMGLAMLAGCTWFGAPVDVGAPGGAPGNATIGSGPITVGLIAADEPDNPSGGSANAVFIAAGFAQTKIKDSPLRILFRRYDGNPNALAGLVDEFLREGVSLVIGPDDPSAGTVLSGKLGTSGIPTVLIASDGASAGTSTYAAGVSPKDEAATIGAEVLERGYAGILLVSTAAPDSRALSSLIAQSATASQIVVTPIEASDPPAARQRFEAIAASGVLPSAIVFATGPETAIRIVQ